MHDLLTRMHRTKLVLTCLVLLVLGVALIALGDHLDGSEASGWIEFVPLRELGGILIGAGLLSVWLDHLFRREQAAIDELRLRRLLEEHAPTMRDAVLEAFAANRDDLKRVATPELLDQIIRNSLALRLDDDQFATEVYDDIRDQAVLASERWHDASLAINLAPFPIGKGSADGGTLTTPSQEFFSVTVRCEYTTTPRHPQRRFVCVSDRQEYAELAHERGATSAWYFTPKDGVDAGSRQAFELLAFAVNGRERSIRRTERKQGQVYTASVGSEHIKAGAPVTISYTYRTVTRRDGHLLFFDIEQPTRDLKVELDYSGCGIASVSVLDLVPSVRPTRIERTPTDLPHSGVRVELDGWTFPRSGVAFVWVLERA